MTPPNVPSRPRLAGGILLCVLGGAILLVGLLFSTDDGTRVGFHDGEYVTVRTFDVPPGQDLAGVVLVCVGVAVLVGGVLLVIVRLQGGGRCT